jgi:hypothetical protein
MNFPTKNIFSTLKKINIVVFTLKAVDYLSSPYLKKRLAESVFNVIQL